MTPRYRRWVRSMDPKIDIDSQEALAAAMLLCSGKNGPNLKKVLNATGVPVREGTRIAERLRKNRIWWRGKLNHGGWGDKETGGIAFWMDVLCGTGMMARSPSNPRAEPK